MTGAVEEKILEQQIRNLKLNLDYEAFYIISVKLHENDSEDVLSELSMKETVKEVFEKVACVYEFGMLDKQVFLLCSSKKHDIERIARAIEEASIMLNRIFRAEIFCGISTCGSLLEDLPDLYAQSLEALEYNLVMKEECYTYYSDILPFQKKEKDWTPELESIEKCITHCSEEELKAEVEKLIQKVRKVHYNLNEYQVVILEVLFAISRLYQKYQIAFDEEFADSKKIAVKILSLDTGKELDNWLMNYCMLIHYLIQKKQVDNNVVLAENAIKIVEKCFSDPALSVETVCRELHVSSSYFSKVFKQETGSTFLNYLTNWRMEAAKRLLDKTNYKSHVIGEMVGYPEPNYFSYVFKKNCGLSPAKYRKLEETNHEK